MLWLRSAFPEVPEQVLRKVVDGDVNPASPSMEGVPWNRHKRRSVSRASRMTVLVHPFAGDHKWQGPAPIIEVEKTRGADLLEGGFGSI